MSDNPYPPPAPSVLVHMLRIHAWADSIDDDSRMYHEWCADTIEQLLRHNGRLVARNERLELDYELKRRAAFGSQKGGAA